MTPRKPNGTLRAFLTETPNLPRARCVGTDPDLWNSDTAPSETPRARDARVARAVAICEVCPDLAPCRAWAESLRLFDLNSVVVAASVRPSIAGKKLENPS